MKVGDLVRYTRDMPTSFAEFQHRLRNNDLGLVIDTIPNKTTVKVRWIKDGNEFWMGKNHLEVVSGRQETESN